jgi:hypothetical protein
MLVNKSPLFRCVGIGQEAGNTEGGPSINKIRKLVKRAIYVLSQHPTGRKVPIRPKSTI